MADSYYLVYIIGLSTVFGISMKIADLLDEHGMRLFPCARIAFGLLWGAFGALLVLSDVFVANAILAMVLAFLIRLRLDYRNHALAAVIIIVVFITRSSFLMGEFCLLWTCFSLFGMAKDYLGDVRKTQDLVYWFMEIAPYNLITSFIYSFTTGRWLVFIAILCATLSYDGVKYGFYKLGFYRQL
jgi:hypothetical protein